MRRHRSSEASNCPCRPQNKLPKSTQIANTVGHMADSDIPWEPPLAGSELEHLVGALERLRTTFLWKADGLDAQA